MLAEERQPVPCAQLSRRALFGAAAVLAIPAAAQAAAEADAELIAMGVHLDEVLPELHRRLDLHNERCRAAHVAAKAEHQARGLQSDREIAEVYIRHEQAAGVSTGDADWEPLCNSLEPLYQRAATLQATTLAGLRTKVLLALENYSPSGRVDEVYGLDDMLADLQRMCGAAA